MSARDATRTDAWLKATFAWVLIWTLAGGSVWLARSMKPTAAEVIAFLRQQDVATLPADHRELVMHDAASRLNRLGFAEMREVRQSRALFAFYRPLPPVEKERFCALIVPTGLRRIMDASLEVPADQRAAFLERALYFAVIDFSVAQPPIDPVALERIEREALRSYIADLSPAKRAEMAPQLEQLRSYLEPAKD